MPRLTQAQISAKLNAARKALGGVPGTWTHRKSGVVYAVAGVGLTAVDTPEVLVRYRRVDGSRQAQLVDWHRPLGEFLEKFDRNARHQPDRLEF